MILLILSYPGGNDAFSRHWPYFLRSGSDRLIGIGTTDQNCRFPEGCESVQIGTDRYISGRHLPQRLIDALAYGLNSSQDEHICLCEYDTVFFRPLSFLDLPEGVAAHYAGGPTWGSKGKIGFHHNPHLFTREAAEKFVGLGQKLIEAGLCSEGSPESSPDVFFTLVCEINDIPVRSDLWLEYSRNDLKNLADLEAARTARINGAHVIHGVKTSEELAYITR